VPCHRAFTRRGRGDDHDGPTPIDPGLGHRGISPVVGAALLAAIAVVFAAAVGGIAFALTDTQPPAPSASMALVPGAGCDYRLVHRSGDALRGDRLSVRGVADPDGLAGRRLAAGSRAPVDPTAETVTVVWRAPGGDDAYVLARFEGDRYATPAPGCAGGLGVPGVAYTTDGGTIVALGGNGTAPVELSATTSADALGPGVTDLTGDGSSDVPYVTTSDAVRLTNASNDTATLATSGDITGTIEGGKTRLAVAGWDGAPTSVYFVDETHDTLYRVAPGGSVTTVASPGNGVQAAVGPGDVDGDGTDEFVFADASQQLRYLDPGGGGPTNLAGGQLGSNNGIGAGAVADFDGDGQEAVVAVDGSNQVKLTDESTTVTLTPGIAAKSPPAVADVDGDATPEVLFVRAGSGDVVFVDDVLGANAVAPLADATGGDVAGSDDAGVA
jgi:FlaG/FlaF family flagellin (archaellin)